DDGAGAPEIVAGERFTGGKLQMIEGAQAPERCDLADDDRDQGNEEQAEEGEAEPAEPGVLRKEALDQGVEGKPEAEREEKAGGAPEEPGEPARLRRSNRNGFRVRFRIGIGFYYRRRGRGIGRCEGPRAARLGRRRGFGRQWDGDRALHLSLSPIRNSRAESKRICGSTGSPAALRSSCCGGRKRRKLSSTCFALLCPPRPEEGSFDQPSGPLASKTDSGLSGKSPGNKAISVLPS